MAACSHLDQGRVVEPAGEIVGCEGCLRIGRCCVDQLVFQPVAE